MRFEGIPKFTMELIRREWLYLSLLETHMQMNTMADWEQWVKLFRENPEEFERKRLAAIEELIMSQPEQVRRSSRQLQWRIDAVRRRAPNSLASCIRIYDMLMDSVYGPGGLLEIINGEFPQKPAARPKGRGDRGVCLQLRKKPGPPSSHQI